MKTLRWLSISSLFLPALSGGCDSLDAGRIPESSASPKLVRIMVQDDHTRGLALDLFDKTKLACNAVNPCPPEVDGDLLLLGIDGPSCQIPEGQTEGTCINPRNPELTRATVDAIQIRLVFDKLLNPELYDIETDGMITKHGITSDIAALYVDGVEVETDKRYDNAGSPTLTSNALDNPYGPAIVLKPKAALAPGKTYTIKIDPSKISDKAGQKPEFDSDQEEPTINTEYRFDTEALFALASDAKVSKNVIVTIGTNADFNVGTVKTATIVVKDADGKRIPVIAFADQGADATMCSANTRQVNLVPVRIDEAMGMAPSGWEPGEYTVEIFGVKHDGGAEIKADAFGTAPFTTKFTVEDTMADPEKDPHAIDKIVLPTQCQ